MGRNKIDLAKDTVYTHPSSIQCNASSEINSLKSSVSNGKNLIANAITGKGVATSSSDTFATMANNINGLKVPLNSYFTNGLLSVYETPPIYLSNQEHISESPGCITYGGTNYYCQLYFYWNTDTNLQVRLCENNDIDESTTICKITRTYNALTNTLTVGVTDTDHFVSSYNIYSDGNTYHVRINFSHTGSYGALTFETRDYLLVTSDTALHTYVKNRSGDDANVYIPISSVKVVSA